VKATLDALRQLKRAESLGQFRQRLADEAKADGAGNHGSAASAPKPVVDSAVPGEQE